MSAAGHDAALETGKDFQFRELNGSCSRGQDLDASQTRRDGMECASPLLKERPDEQSSCRASQ